MDLALTVVIFIMFMQYSNFLSIIFSVVAILLFDYKFLEVG